MKIVLMVNPPSPFLINPIAFPPLGLLYVAAAVEQAGHGAEIVDLAAGEDLEGRSPDMIGISACTPHVPLMAKIVSRLQWIYPGVPIILGGPHFTQRPGDAQKLGVDRVCVGDGELAIVRALNGESGCLKGLINVDEGPLPARYLINLSRYEYFIDGIRATSMITSRGCPYSCAYCSRGFGYDRLRNHRLDLVEKELDDIKRRGFQAIMLYDDELNISSRRLAALCEVLQGAGVKWRGFVRSNLFTRNQADVMLRSGCVEVCCGVESGSDAILKACHKHATVNDATTARYIAGSVGLRFKAFMMIGMPGETEVTVEQTRQWLMNNKPDDFDLCPYTPYPGSDVSNHPEKYDIIADFDYWHEVLHHKGKPGQYHVTAHTSSLSRERIAELRDRIEREVREAIS